MTPFNKTFIVDGEVCLKLCNKLIDIFILFFLITFQMTGKFEEEPEIDPSDEVDISVEDEEDEEETDTPSQPRRKHHRRRPEAPHPARQAKRQCCMAGKKAAPSIKAPDARAECTATGRKFVVHRKEFQNLCAASFARCCAVTVHHR